MTGSARSAKDFFAPLAVGAPTPLREIPARPSRAIHFFDPSNEKMAAKVPHMAGTVDVLLGNLEDAVKADRKEAARHGLVTIARETDFTSSQLWTRVNELASPWVLEDLTQLVTEVGEKLEVIMVPKVEGPWDIHYVDRLLAQLEARAKLERPLLVHAILETAQGVTNLEETATAISGAMPSTLNWEGLSTVMFPPTIPAVFRDSRSRSDSASPNPRRWSRAWRPRSMSATRAITSPWPRSRAACSQEPAASSSPKPPARSCFSSRIRTCSVGLSGWDTAAWGRSSKVNPCPGSAIR